MESARATSLNRSSTRDACAVTVESLPTSVERSSTWSRYAGSTASVKCHVGNASASESRARTLPGDSGSAGERRLDGTVDEHAVRVLVHAQRDRPDHGQIHLDRRIGDPAQPTPARECDAAKRSEFHRDLVGAGGLQRICRDDKTEVEPRGDRPQRLVHPRRYGPVAGAGPRQPRSTHYDRHGGIVHGGGEGAFERDLHGRRHGRECLGNGDRQRSSRVRRRRKHDQDRGKQSRQREEWNQDAAASGKSHDRRV